MIIMLNMHNLLIKRKKKEIMMNIKIILNRKHFTEEQINFILNYVTVIAKNVIYTEFQIIIKDALFACLNILMII